MSPPRLRRRIPATGRPKRDRAPGAPVILGLTGGIGSGKSEALRAFGRHGAATLSSDEGVRRLYTREPVKAAVREHFGPQVITADGADKLSPFADGIVRCG